MKPPAGRALPSRLALAVLLAALLASPSVVSALDTSPGAILAAPDRVDGQSVTVRGTITNLSQRVSRWGNDYFTFDLSDGRRAIKVFSFGVAPCRAGAAVIVQGRFQKVKQRSGCTFYNEVEAESIACR